MEALNRKLSLDLKVSAHVCVGAPPTLIFVIYSTL